MDKFNNKICSHHDIAEILLKLALNTNQSINQLMVKIENVNIKFSVHDTFLE